MIASRSHRFTVAEQARQAYVLINDQPYRSCLRCGRRNMVRYKSVKGDYICRDCQLVDPAFGKD